MTLKIDEQKTYMFLEGIIKGWKKEEEEEGGKRRRRMNKKRRRNNSLTIMTMVPW